MKSKYSFILLLLLYGGFIWLRDTRWIWPLDNSLPLLAALLLFYYFGRPWQLVLREDISFTKHGVIAATTFVIGIVSNTTTLLVISWLVVLYCWLENNLTKEQFTEIKPLMIFPALAFPWIILDFSVLGWIFRFSGAVIVEKVCYSIGLQVLREGTTLLVEGVPLAVTSACSGLNTLQAMFIAGYSLLYVVVGKEMKVIPNFIGFLFISWIANTIRIFVICFCALSFGAEFAMSAFHTWGGSLVLVLMFLLTFVYIKLQAKYLSSEINYRQILPIFIITLSALLSSDLLVAWSRSPFEQFAWIALLLWICPIFFRKSEAHMPILFLGFFFAIIGWVGDLNFLQHVGLACSVGSLLISRYSHIIWLVSAIAWMPAFGWIGSHYFFEYVIIARIFLVLVGLASLRLPKDYFPKVKDYRISESVAWGVLAIAFTLGVVSEFYSLPTAKKRFEAIPREGIAFSSIEIPLTPQETATFGQAQVIKRLYHFGRESYVLTIVDGTRDRHAVHDPLYCFRGSGWEVEKSSELLFSGGKIRLLDLQQNKTKQEAVYWFSDGDTYYNNMVLYWFQTTLRRLTFGYSGQEPLLIIIYPYKHQTTDWPMTLARFRNIIFR